ncbi:hypothetical protein CASFOL_025703 [Castilleja foliolosa]|uniref:DRBM domain-containing protein n=1 Tax=Castilleja foliolosa TaxID=1961234 RepID=A0ABD3CUE3_9LAMI
MVQEFVMNVQGEDEAEIYGGLIKAPKVLADIVESLAAAVYVDCNFNLKDMWVIIRNLLEPLITLDVLEQQPQPVTTLFELCQRDGKKLEIKHNREGEKNIASVYVNGNLVASASAEQKENSKIHAAKVALKELGYESNTVMNADICGQLNGDNEIGAKQRLHEICGKKKWQNPNYKIQSEAGPAHEKRYKCSVEIELSDAILLVTGGVRSRVKEAENSAAFVMIRGLNDSKYI